MIARRSFMAFLGGIGVTGLATTRASVARPTLILPPGLVPTTAPAVPFPLLAGCKTRMHAIFSVMELLEPSEMDQWLEAGLQIGERHRNGPLRVDRVAAEIAAEGEARR